MILQQAENALIVTCFRLESNLARSGYSRWLAFVQPKRNWQYYEKTKNYNRILLICEIIVNKDGNRLLKAFIVDCKR